MQIANMDELHRLYGVVLKLDVGCGASKQEGFVGLDRRALPGVDVVQDVEELPWPFPDNTFNTILMSHLWEHIQPKFRVDVMNELWRITEVGGLLWIAAPYATSFGANQDPTHYPCPNEVTFKYFTPTSPLYGIYQPKPWVILKNAWQLTGNMEIVLKKILEGNK